MVTTVSDERVKVFVEIKFSMTLPPGSEVPSPQTEAIMSAALAIAGPCFEIATGSTVIVSGSPIRGPK
jgi:hypothetical protein